MRKRLTAVFAVLLLTTVMSVTAFAKPSPEGGKTRAYDAYGKELKILKIEQEEWTDFEECSHGEDCMGTVELVTPVSEKYRAVVDSLDIKQLVDGTEYEKKEWSKMYEMEMVFKECVKFPIKLTFDRDDWEEGAPLLAYYMAEEENWKIAALNVEEKDGTYYVEFDSEDDVSAMVFFLDQGDVVETDAPAISDDRMFTIAIAATIVIGLAVTNFMFRKRA